MAARPLRLVPRGGKKEHAPARNRGRALLGPFIGRDDLVAQVASTVREGARVITLLGPPGIGKTRLAHGCVEHLAQAFPNTWFCDLTEVVTEEGLRFAVLSTLGAPPDATDPAELLGALGPCLLVLDNFEQIASAATCITPWCEQAPDLVVLVTSRERLAVRGVVVEVPPLPADASAALFARCARDAGGTCPEDAPLVPLVERLEGIPLAIELTAAATRVLSIADIERRLAAGHPTHPPQRSAGRHATLESAIARSWDLLLPDEQGALAQCSVFAGGFSVEGAERVLGNDALALVTALRDKSLLRATDDGRLFLFASVRDFAGRKLSLAEGGAARARHVAAFADLARRFHAWYGLLDRTPDARVSDVMRREKENVVAALGYVREDDPRDRAELAAAAATLRALPTETCLQELGASLALLGPEHVHERALLLFARQSVFAAFGEYERALADVTALAATPGMPAPLALLARAYEGILLRHASRPREAWAPHEQVREALRALDFPRLAAMNAACMGRLAFDLGDLDASRRLNEEAIRVGESVNDRWVVALALANLAQLEQELQQFERAHELLAEALERLRHVGEIYEAVYSNACGDLFFEWGRLEEAHRWYVEGTRYLGGPLRTHRVSPLAHASAAALEATRGEHELARARITEARRLAARNTNPAVNACVELHGVCVELLTAHEPGRAAALEAARRTVASHADPTSPLGAVVATSLEARFALRIAGRLLANAEGVGRLHVDAAGAWFEVEGGGRVQLGRRGALRRILAGLAAKRLREPDHGLKLTDLVTLGWPGERVLADAAATRVRVAIATLRQLGLRAYLLTRDDGYLLDAHVDLVVK